MELQCEGVGEILVIHVSGRIEGANAEQFGREIEMTIGSGSRQVLLDLSGVRYINSAGLRVVLVVAKSLKKPGSRCGLCGLCDEVRHVFDIAGFTRILQVYPDVHEAVSDWKENL